MSVRRSLRSRVQQKECDMDKKSPTTSIVGNWIICWLSLREIDLVLEANSLIEFISIGSLLFGNGVAYNHHSLKKV